jgi:hypothetical protein
MYNSGEMDFIEWIFSSDLSVEKKQDPKRELNCPKHMHVGSKPVKP